MDFKPARERLLEAVEDNDVLAVKKLVGSDNPTDCCSQNVYDRALIFAAQLGHKDIVQLLLVRGANIDKKDERCGTALMAAAENGYEDIVKLLVDNEASVNIKLRNGETALILAVQKSQSPEMIKYLLSNGANVNVTDRDGKTPAFICIEQHDLDNLKVLIDYEADLSMKNSEGKAALEASSDKTILDLVHLFLECKMLYPEPHLFTAIDRNSPEMVKALLYCSFVEVELEREENTPLTWALKKGCQQEWNEWNPSLKTDPKIIKLMIMHGADVNHTDKCGNLPLCLAASSGQSDLVSLLLIYNADVNARHTAQNMTALMYAAQNGNLDVVKRLIDYGASLDLVSYNMNSALTFAFEKGNISCARLLLNEGAIINSRHDSHVIAKNDQCESFKLLMEQMDISDLSSDILFIAVQEACFKMAELLIDMGMDVNATNILGSNVLVEASSVEMAKMLLNKGALINIPDHAVLVQLCSSDIHVSLRDKMVEFLLQKGAEVDMVNSQGTTALIQAATCERQESSQLLINAGSDVNKANYQGHTALMMAAQKGNIPIMRLLINKGANVNMQNIKGYTALMYATMNSHSDAVQFLLNNGADANLAENSGRSTIFMTQTDNMIQLLVDNGADMNKQDKQGLSPLMLAACDRNEGLLKTLIEFGADVNAVSSIKKETALSFIITCKVLRKKDYGTIEVLVKAGSTGNRHHHCDTTIARMVVGNNFNIVKLCLNTGFLFPSPVCIKCLNNFHCVPLHFAPRLAEYMNDETEISLLQLALMHINIQMARYLVANIVLVQSDLSKKALKNFYSYLRNFNQHQRSIAFLDKLLYKPFALKLLSFVAVSDALKFSLGREQRVRAINLPSIQQSRLLFKEEVPIEECLKGNESLSPSSDWFLSNVIS